MRRLLLTTAAAALVTAAGTAQAQELRIGFIATLSGGGAILGKTTLQGFTIGLNHEGWTKDGDKLGGVPTKLLTADAQRKPDVALRAARRLIQSDRVQVITGTLFSNIAMAIYRTAIRSKRVYLSANAGPSPIASRLCSPYYAAVSFQNDMWGETLGKRMTDEGIKRVFTMAPNYQAGKDMISGFRRYFKGGTEVGTILFKLGQRDYQADISKIVSSKPEALFVFAPGGMGIAFMKQWKASGAGRNIKLYTLAVVDGLTIAPIGVAAEGARHTSNWSHDLPNDVNKKFVRDFVARYKGQPAFYSAQGYDAARLLAAAVRKIGGKVDDHLALAKALRRTPFPSTRGTVTFNVNGMPIQNWYKRDVVDRERQGHAQDDRPPDRQPQGLLLEGLPEAEPLLEAGHSPSHLGRGLGGGPWRAAPKFDGYSPPLTPPPGGGEFFFAPKR